MSLILTLGTPMPWRSRPQEGRHFRGNQGLPALQKLEVEAPTIEAITALVSPQLANIERVGDAVLA